MVFLSSLISGKSNNSDITQENFQAHLGGDRENWYLSFAKHKENYFKKTVYVQDDVSCLRFGISNFKSWFGVEVGLMLKQTTNFQWNSLVVSALDLAIQVCKEVARLAANMDKPGHFLDIYVQTLALGPILVFIWFEFEQYSRKNK